MMRLVPNQCRAQLIPLPIKGMLSFNGVIGLPELSLDVRLTSSTLRYLLRRSDAIL